MEATEILEKLESIGIEVTISGAGDKLRLNPGAAVPPELLEEVRARKGELLWILRTRGYRLKYPDSEITNKELAEVSACVYQIGVCLLWSNTLNDLVAFYKNETDKAKIPPGFVPYSLKELIELFKRPVPINKLRLIHAAKQQGAKVESDKPTLKGEI